MSSFRITFNTNSRITAIKALRSASASTSSGMWTLQFSKEAVDCGIITRFDSEALLIMSLLSATIREFAAYNSQPSPGDTEKRYLAFIFEEINPPMGVLFGAPQVMS